MINDYLTYVTLAIVISVIPGPAVILTIKNSLKYGFKVSMANVLGNFVAMVVLAILSAIGLGAIILASSSLFTAAKFLGCIYLVYLGIKAWRSPCLQESVFDHIENSSNISSVFREGLIVGLANPKAIGFFTALFPQFIDPSQPYIPQFFTLIFTMEGISFVFLTAYAFLSSVISPYLSSKKSMTVVNKLSGIAFIGFGALLIYED